MPTAINESGSQGAVLGPQQPMVILGPPSPAKTADPIATTISTAADIYAQQQDRAAANREVKKAEADRARAIADANAAAAKMRADLTSFSTGQAPAWFWPTIIAGGGVLGLFFFINRSKRRR